MDYIQALIGCGFAGMAAWRVVKFRAFVAEDEFWLDFKFGADAGNRRLAKINSCVSAGLYATGAWFLFLGLV